MATRLHRALAVLTGCLLLVLVGMAGPGQAPLAAQSGTPPASQSFPPRNGEETETLVRAILARMTPAQRVGQLFLVTFVGDDLDPNSAIARLVRDWEVGGVVLLPGNENFRNEPGSDPEFKTAAAVVRLTNGLQTLAFRDLETPLVLPDGRLNPVIAESNSIPGLPLFIAVNQEGDGPPYTALISGFTPIPSNLAIGATWQPEWARQIGNVVGAELAAVGVNLLLGPSLDVLDNPRPELKGYPGTRTFGGDAYWVAQMGKAFITGVHEGSQGRVATVAKHFPGQGSSDRRPDREVATVQKPLPALQQVELVPFYAVTAGTTPTATTDALMTSHVRYKGFQENPRQLTPPISLAPELQTIMGEFAAWRAGGGVLVSDSLGVGALKRYYQAYEPDRFPNRRVAQEAFLAGNDLLFLAQFDRDGIWAQQMANMEDTIGYFRQKYEEDAAFRSRVDEAVTRILRLKLRLYPQLSWAETQRSTETLPSVLNKGGDLVAQIARAAITLIYPGATELADRLPSAPLASDRILIFTDDRPLRECPSCPALPTIPTTALQDIILRLYGPAASDQVRPEFLHSAGFAELDALLRQAEGAESLPAELQLSPERLAELNDLIRRANWLIFAMQDVDQETLPSSAALRRFLDQRVDILRDKNLVVFAFNAPYFLSDTEIGKLTAYYGLYSKVGPFLETAVRVLFRELTPPGKAPVSIAGINYDLGRQLEPDPGQRFPLTLLLPTADGNRWEEANTAGGTLDITVGDSVLVRAGPVKDRNGHPVPDGTLVEFRFFDPQGGIELPRRQVPTVNGLASVPLTIERAGSLQLSATAGDGAGSQVLLLTVGGEAGALVSTATPTVTPTPTATPEPTATPTPEPTATATPTPPSETTPTAHEGDRGNGFLGVGGRVNLVTFAVAILAILVAFFLYYLLIMDRQPTLTELLRHGLWMASGALVLYLLYAVGWLPGSAFLHERMGLVGVLVLTLLGSFVSVLGAIRLDHR
jgi:beta-N-acetylhexosaminidase